MINRYSWIIFDEFHQRQGVVVGVNWGIFNFECIKVDYSSDSELSTSSTKIYQKIKLILIKNHYKTLMAEITTLTENGHNGTPALMRCWGSSPHTH